MEEAHHKPRSSSTHFIDVLVVEDRPMARRLLQAELDTADDLRICGEARDGKEGVRLVKELSPDVVIMDVVMPRMDGIQATREIRTFSDVPIILLTGSQREAQSLRDFSRQAGADAFFLKPSGPVSADLYRIRDALLDEIRRLAERRGTR